MNAHNFDSHTHTLARSLTRSHKTATSEQHFEENGRCFFKFAKLSADDEIKSVKGRKIK